mmetsp:Transcript_68480/g.160995  ORF Transcript_68480/g.160995 Transcript_68480/m.160995 type:complete len:213 (+) Transcript_68480:575-1213(+)
MGCCIQPQSTLSQTRQKSKCRTSWTRPWQRMTGSHSTQKKPNMDQPPKSAHSFNAQDLSRLRQGIINGIHTVMRRSSGSGESTVCDKLSRGNPTTSLCDNVCLSDCRLPQLQRWQEVACSANTSTTHRWTRSCSETWRGCWRHGGTRWWHYLNCPNSTPKLWLPIVSSLSLTFWTLCVSCLIRRGCRRSGSPSSPPPPVAFPPPCVRVLCLL